MLVLADFLVGVVSGSDLKLGFFFPLFKKMFSFIFISWRLTTLQYCSLKKSDCCVENELCRKAPQCELGDKLMAIENNPEATIDDELG